MVLEIPFDINIFFKFLSTKWDKIIVLLENEDVFITKLAIYLTEETIKDSSFNVDSLESTLFVDYDKLKHYKVFKSKSKKQTKQIKELFSNRANLNTIIEKHQEEIKQLYISYYTDFINAFFDEYEQGNLSKKQILKQFVDIYNALPEYYNQYVGSLVENNQFYLDELFDSKGLFFYEMLHKFLNFSDDVKIESLGQEISKQIIDDQDDRNIYRVNNMIHLLLQDSQYFPAPLKNEILELMKDYKNYENSQWRDEIIKELIEKSEYGEFKRESDISLDLINWLMLQKYFTNNEKRKDDYKKVLLNIFSYIFEKLKQFTVEEYGKDNDDFKHLKMMLISRSWWASVVID